MDHELKTINPYFQRCWLGEKLFEVRINDRSYQRGDIITLREYNPQHNSYTGREIKGGITYVLNEYPEAIKEGYAVFSYEIYDRVDKSIPLPFEK